MSGSLAVQAVLAFVTALALYLCWKMVAPFVPALTWAWVLTIFATPLHEKLARRLGRPGLAAGVTTAVVAVCIAVPLVALAPVATDALREGWESVRSQPFQDRLDQAMRGNSWLAPMVAFARQHFPTEELAKQLAPGLPGAVMGSFQAGLQLLIALFVLFYMLRDRRQGLRCLRSWLPLRVRESDLLLHRVEETVRASVVGTLFVAAIQGALGGLMFWWLGLPGAVLWGVVMFVLSVLPVLGAAIVWLPAAILLAMEGSWEKALILTAWGSVVVALIDNLLYPIFVGNRLRLHTVPMFIAIVGGLVVFGASGLVLGPVVLTVAVVLLEIWRARASAPARGEAAYLRNDAQ